MNLNPPRNGEQRNARFEVETRPFKVVMLYESGDAGIRAMNLYKRLIHRLGNSLAFSFDLWRFDILELPEIRTAALRAGAAADLIIVSADGDKDLSQTVKLWIHECVDRKEPDSGGMVGLLGPETPSNSVRHRIWRYLSDAAMRNRITLHLQPSDTSSLNGCCRPGHSRWTTPPQQGDEAGQFQ